MPDLDALPFPDRDLFLTNAQVGTPSTRRGAVRARSTPAFLTIIAGRGCKYNCNFCQPPKLLFGRKVRKRSPANIIAGTWSSCASRYPLCQLYVPTTTA